MTSTVNRSALTSEGTLTILRMALLGLGSRLVRLFPWETSSRPPDTHTPRHPEEQIFLIFSSKKWRRAKRGNLGDREMKRQADERERCGKGGAPRLLGVKPCTPPRRGSHHKLRRVGKEDRGQWRRHGLESTYCAHLLGAHASRPRF